MIKNIVWKGVRTSLQEDNNVTIKFDGSEFEANLPLYLDEVNHSPTGFEWGYYGSGPSQLAYAILRSYYFFIGGHDIPTSIKKAKAHYMLFKGDFVAKWKEEWEINSDEVEVWLTGERVSRIGAEREGWV